MPKGRGRRSERLREPGRCHYVVLSATAGVALMCDRTAGHRKAHHDKGLGIWWDYDARAVQGG
jgi:hypothetical protein